MIAKISWLLALSLVFASVRSFAATAAMNIIDFQFVPQSVTVNLGDTVQWTNQGPSIHTTTSDTGVWDSGAMAPGQSFGYGSMASGQSFSRIFGTAGTFTYHCTIHPFMTGSVIVQKPPPPLPSTKTGVGVAGSLLTIKLSAGVNAGRDADWWLVALAPSKHWYSFIYPNTWVDIGTDLSNVRPAYQGQLFDISNRALYNTKGLRSGTYAFYFGVDTNRNGVLDFDQLYYSSFSLNAP